MVVWDFGETACGEVGGVRLPKIIARAIGCVCAGRCMVGIKLDGKVR